MILLQINSTANWGSTGKIAEQIGLRAIQHGWESYIAYGRYANPSQSKLIKIGSKVSMFWHLLESRLLDNHGLASRIATKRLIKQIEQIQPDVIHLHNIHGYYLNYELLFNYLNKIDTPVVWTLHDCWAFTGHCAHYITKGCNQWMDKCHDCHHCNAYPKSHISRVQRNFDLKRSLFTRLNERLTIVPVSKWLSSQTKQSLFATKRIHHIYNGVDVSVFQPTEVSKHDSIKGKFSILSVASAWSNEKGLSDFIKLRERLPDSYAIILLGLSDNQMRDLPSNIIGIRRTQSQQELAEWYSAADVVMSLSKAETFGLTIAEAMACGTPAITYSSTALPELITSDTGVVVEQGDIDGVVAAIKEIEHNGKEHYSEACRKRAEEHFDKDKCFEQYIELYNELTNNTK